MRRAPHSGRQFRQNSAVLSAIIASAIGLVLITALQPWVDPRWLYMDTQTVGELSGDCCHIYDGAMSTLGIMLWAATAAVCLFAALLFFPAHRTRAVLFGLHGFTLSALLALDDAYLLHEVAGPKIGIPQTLMIGLITAAIVTYLGLQRRYLFGSYSWLLGLSLSCFGLSVGIDQVFHSTGSVWVVAEDGPKFIGIVAWFLFHLMTQVKLVLMVRVSHS